MFRGKVEASFLRDSLCKQALKAMEEDVHAIVKRYPGASLAAVVVVSFVVAHAVHRRD
jgi:hypothetical protein